MGRQLFRKRSLEKISSPEQLNDYVKVANPGVWVILAAVIFFLLGVFVWGIFGKLNTSVRVVGAVENKRLSCYIREEDISQVKAGSKIMINGNEYELNSVSQSPVEVSEDMDSYIRYLGNLNNGEWVYIGQTDTTNEQDGVYEIRIQISQVSPISFVTN